MQFRLRLLGLGLVWMLGAEAMASAPPSPPVPIRCSASGAKFITPAMSDNAVCAHFIAAIPGGRAAAVTPGDGLAVELRFLPRGMAMADVTRLEGGKVRHRQRFELAVSDRGFQPRDIDRLAGDVAAGMLNRR